MGRLISAPDERRPKPLYTLSLCARMQRRCRTFQPPDMSCQWVISFLPNQSLFPLRCKNFCRLIQDMVATCPVCSYSELAMCGKELSALQSLVFQSHKPREVALEIELTQVISARRMLLFTSVPRSCYFPKTTAKKQPLY